jgi:hypothetical protein
VLSFFALAMVIVAIMVYWFTRCIRSVGADAELPQVATQE